MNKIDSSETQLVSGALPSGGDIQTDEKGKLYQLANEKLNIDKNVWDRIDWLAEKVLILIGIERAGGWEKLFRDPADGRYWLLTYPFSELQGGGPPSLICKRFTEAEIKSGFLSPSEWDEHMEQFMRERNIRFIPSRESSEEK